MRGKVSKTLTGTLTKGITPAYAGKSFCNVACNISIGDHPRVCGEKMVRLSGMLHTLGSPPRMRGKAG